VFNRKGRKDFTQKFKRVIIFATEALNPRKNIFNDVQIRISAAKFRQVK